MNIDYAKIIETANARKETLQRLEDLLANAPIYVERLTATRDWAYSVANVFGDLDKEGRDLLPKPTRTALEGLGYTLEYLNKALNTNPRQDQQTINFGLEHLHD